MADETPKKKMTEYQKTKWLIVGVTSGLIIESILLWFWLKEEVWQWEKRGGGKQAQITGTIVCDDVTGAKPVKDAEIFAYNPLYGGFKFSRTGTTGGFGVNVTVDADPTKITSYELTITAPGYTGVKKTVTLSGSKNIGNLSIGPCGGASNPPVATVYVYAEYDDKGTKQPLAGVKVWTQGPYNSLIVANSLTDAYGKSQLKIPGTLIPNGYAFVFIAMAGPTPPVTPASPGTLSSISMNIKPGDQKPVSFTFTLKQQTT